MMVRRNDGSSVFAWPVICNPVVHLPSCRRQEASHDLEPYRRCLVRSLTAFGMACLEK